MPDRGLVHIVDYHAASADRLQELLEKDGYAVERTVRGAAVIVQGRCAARDPEAERAEVQYDLLRRLPRIDSRYFYDDRGSELFEQITRLPEYYQTRTEEAILARIADEEVLLDVRTLDEGDFRAIRDALLRVAEP